MTLERQHCKTRATKNCEYFIILGLRKFSH